MVVILTATALLCGMATGILSTEALSELIHGQATWFTAGKIACALAFATGAGMCVAAIQP